MTFNGAPLSEERATAKLAAAIQAEVQEQMRALMSEMSQRTVELCVQLCSKRFSEALDEDRTAKVRAAASKGAELTADEAARASAAILVSAAAVASGTEKSATVTHVTTALDPRNKRNPRESVLNAMSEIKDLMNYTDAVDPKGKGKGKVKGKDGKGPLEQQSKGPAQGFEEGRGKGKGLDPHKVNRVSFAADVVAKGTKGKEPGGVSLDPKGDARGPIKGPGLQQESKGNAARSMPAIPEGSSISSSATSSGTDTQSELTDSPPRGNMDGKGLHTKGKGKPKGQVAPRESVLDGLFGGLFG